MVLLQLKFINFLKGIDMKLDSTLGKIGVGVLSLLLVGIVFRSVTSNSALPTETDKIKALKNLPSSEIAQTVEGFIAGNGVVEPADRESKLSTSIAGVVTEVLVKEGQFVKKDVVLVKFDSAKERVSLKLAQAELDMQKAELKRVIKGLRKEDVETIFAETHALQAKSDLSAASFARLLQLANSGGISAEELQKAEKNSEADKASLNAAQARKKSAVAGSRSEDIEIAEAKFKQAQANLELAQTNLKKTEIIAPFDGEVLQIKIRVGEYINPSSNEAIIFGDTTKLRARIDIDERNISKLIVGAEAYVTLSAYPGQKFFGKLVEVGRRMGRKNVRTDDPTERIDTKILETVLEISEKSNLVPGVRVTGYIKQNN
jgi:HlyD family secretion protein